MVLFPDSLVLLREKGHYVFPIIVKQHGFVKQKLG
jgi:hypothetical protein